MSKASTTTPSTTRTIPPCLSHFVIFNPTIKPATIKASSSHDENESKLGHGKDETGAPTLAGAAESAPTSRPEDRDRDLEDDLREAAQIVFYTSRSSLTVSRDTMLKQTGLIRGLMGFSDMLVPSSADERFMSIKSSNSRLVVFRPEADFYIGVDVTLAHTVGEDGNKQGIATSQGLSDALILGALERGYADFRLLYGQLKEHLPPTPATSSLLERYWTRFAFAFENDTLHPSLSLDQVLPPNQTPEAHTSQAVQRALEVFIEDSELQSLDYGVIAPPGPLYGTISDPALDRFLVSLLSATLPPVLEPKGDTRHTLGLGRTARESREVRDRKTSWGLGWVPTLPGLTPRSATPTSVDDMMAHKSGQRVTSTEAASTHAEGGVRGTEAEKSRWGFGMSHLGLGDALGTVGGVFGLGGTAKSATRTAQTTAMIATPAGSGGDGSIGESRRTSLSSNPPLPSGEVAVDAVRTSGAGDAPSATRPTQSLIGAAIVDHIDRMVAGDTASLVSSTAVDVDDLQAAVEVEEVDLGWEKRNVFLETPQSNGGAWAKRRLSWVIRDNVLIYVLYPTDAEPPFETPPSQATLSLYSKLGSILSPDRAVQASRAAVANTAIVVSSDSTEKHGPEMDTATSTSLAEIHEILHSDISAQEVYGRTTAGKVVVAKRKEEKEEELYLVVGRKDASLTDAEYAVRAMTASNKARKKV